MSSLQIHILPIELSFDSIITVLRDQFEIDRSAMIDLETSIEDLLLQFVDTLYVVIESPYVDKFYRDSYYAYFASKHKEYKRDCIRLSFFRDEISIEYFRNRNYFMRLQEYFLGYLILRPTVPNIFGRSLIHKECFKDNRMLICTHKSNVLINGVKLEIQGFPHSSQDYESISCAETTIWGLMEYFGNRYPDYRPIAISGIINVLNKYSKKRMLPSAGLTVDQISYAIKEFGFGTYIYSRNEAYGESIEQILRLYIESGIPVLAALENDKIGHAILVIGYEKEVDINYEKQSKSTLNYFDEDVEYIDYSEVDRRYVIQDDNLIPLRKISLSRPDQPYLELGLIDWKDVRIDSIIVPLYKRIYLEATVAKQLALNILKDQDLGFKFQESFIFRFFLTSSRSFKYHIAQLGEIDRDIANDLILQKMPKFIWIAEIYQKEDYTRNLASGLIVIDATEASENVKDAVLAGLYPDRCILKNGNEFVSLSQGLTHYFRFQNNLT